MMERNWIACALVALAVLRGGDAVNAQAHVHPTQDSSAAPLSAESAETAMSRMWMRQLGGGWTAMAMAQAYPILTFNAPGASDSPLRANEFYLTQPAIMANIQSADERLVLRTTLNFEGLTQPDGELTGGGWGEGFIDRRHPHTLLHELMLSVNLWDAPGGAASLSAGKGFAPYGTDDPMARPSLKYPTNHHLSQILERWTVNAVYLHRRGTSVEAGWFGGAEPTGPYDLSNIESFGDSWSVRVAQRWGGGTGPAAGWELSGSAARVKEEHHGEEEVTALWNAAIRHERAFAWGSAYALAEYSWSEPEDDDGFFSALAEGMVRRGRHAPYARLELSTRPEYARASQSGEGFFRYDHDASPVAATRWLIANAGYGFSMNAGPLSIRPFVDLQWHDIEEERERVVQPGPICGCSTAGAELRANEGSLFAGRCMCSRQDPPDFHVGASSFAGLDSFWTLSFGARIFFGGEPMRMGSYGVLDDMTAMMRAPDHSQH